MFGSIFLAPAFPCLTLDHILKIQLVGLKTARKTLSYFTVMLTTRLRKHLVHLFPQFRSSGPRKDVLTSSSIFWVVSIAAQHLRIPRLMLFPASVASYHSSKEPLASLTFVENPVSWLSAALAAYQGGLPSLLDTFKPPATTKDKQSIHTLPHRTRAGYENMLCVSEKAY